MADHQSDHQSVLPADLPADHSPVRPADHQTAAGDDPEEGIPPFTASDLITPELDALEAFLATDADEIAALLDLPFSSLLARVEDLGFDAAVLFEELRIIGLIEADLWLTPAQLDLTVFQALTPLQYCEQFPETGAPLVFAVLNAIRLSDEQAKLLATAGGTNLSKSEKIEIGVGASAVGITGLYLLPKLIFHSKQKNGLFKEWEAKLEGMNPGSKGAFEKVNETVIKLEDPGVTIKLSKGSWNHMELEFDTYSGRLLHELRATVPGNLLQRGWNSGYLQRLGSWIKQKVSTSASEAIDDDLRSSVIEDSVLSAEDAEALLDDAGDGRQARIDLDRTIEHPFREFEDLLTGLSRHDLDLPDVVQRSQSMDLGRRAGSLLDRELEEELFENFDSNLDSLQRTEVRLEKNFVEDEISRASSVVTEEADAFVDSIKLDVGTFVEKDFDAAVSDLEDRVTTEIEDVEGAIDERV